MIWPLDETLGLIEPYLPASLILPQVYPQIKAMAPLLPDIMSAYYLECRLGTASTQVDFSTCVSAPQGARDLLGEHPLPDFLLEHRVWRRVWDFLCQWADPQSPFYAEIPLVWLEFDKVDELLPGMPLPCLNFCLNPQYLEKHRQVSLANHPNTQQFQPFAQTALDLVLGQSISAQTKQNLIICFERLPQGGQIIYLSAMLPRQPAVLKVSGAVPRDCFLDYLTQIGWPGSNSALEQLLFTFCQAMETVRFDLTVGSTLSARIGLEFFSNTLHDSDTERQDALHQFVEHGLCTSEQSEALLAWSGYSREIYSQQSWPTRLSRSWYTKLVYQPPHPLELKAYLGFTPGLFSIFSLA